MYELDTNIQHTRREKEFSEEFCTYENEIVFITLAKLYKRPKFRVVFKTSFL